MSILKRVAGWFHLVVLPFEDVRSMNLSLSETRKELDRVRFLLSQAPVMNFPVGIKPLSITGSRYAYLRAETFDAATYSGASAGLQWIQGPSPRHTKWIFIPEMALGTVIFSPNEIPGGLCGE